MIAMEHFRGGLEFPSVHFSLPAETHIDGILGQAVWRNLNVHMSDVAFSDEVFIHQLHSIYEGAMLFGHTGGSAR